MPALGEAPAARPQRARARDGARRIRLRIVLWGGEGPGASRRGEAGACWHAIYVITHGMRPDRQSGRIQKVALPSDAMFLNGCDKLRVRNFKTAMYNSVPCLNVYAPVGCLTASS